MGCAVAYEAGKHQLEGQLVKKKERQGKDLTTHETSSRRRDGQTTGPSTRLENL